MIESLLQDLRYAARTFRRSPGFVLLTIVTMAVGVGANAAIFSVVNAVLLRPLPFDRPDDLVLVQQNNRLTRQSVNNVAPANFLDWRARSRAFAGLAAFRDETYILFGDHPERLNGGLVNANFFDVLGVKPALGRAFQPTDEGRGGARVAILSDALWKDRFGGRRDAIGESIRLNGELHTIVGVMPPDVDYPDRAQLWTPPHWPVPDDSLRPAEDPSSQRDHSFISVLGRIKPGVTRGQAEADISAVAATLEHDFPTSNMNVGAALLSLHDDLVGNVRQTLLMLFAAVGLLLLIAAANVSGLLVARATARHQEMAVRIALGASRGRILRQLLAESVLLALIGGTCGVLLSMWLIGPLTALGPGDLGMSDVHVDVRVLLFSVAISTIAGVVFGLAPARQLLGVDVHRDLKQSARGVTSPGQRRVRAGLVAGQVALSMVLLVGAGLTIRSFIRLQSVPTGFDTTRVLTVGIGLAQARFPTPAQKADFWERVLGALRRVPGVDALGATSRLPLSGGNSSRGIVIDGRADLSAGAEADYRTATPDYFRAFGIPLMRGRTFADDDREDRPPVAVISASMAQRYWPNTDPIGHQVAINPKQPMTIVGIVGDIHHASLEAALKPTFYVPFRQDPWPTMTFVLRTSASAGALTTAVRDAVWLVDKEQPVGTIRTMDEQLSRSLSRRRFSVTLLTAFGIVAVALAAIGLYGVLAFIVAQRRREIGVRMALGARPRDVIAEVLGQGLRLAGLGGLAGVVLALAGTRLLSTLLFGTSPTDALTYATAASLLVLIAVTASFVPALRASRVDPLVALRDE